MPAPLDVEPSGVGATATRPQLTRLMKLWRSAGWPSHDALELDLRVAGWVAAERDAAGRETLHLTDAGLAQLAQARRRQQRAASAHDRIAARMARHLAADGRLVWRELSLRARVEVEGAAPGWRVARPDVFSVRHTSVEAYLHPLVHEVKASRADLLSDLRHEAKRASYQWLCSECHYVFPAGVAEPEEIPEPFGVWVLHGAIEDGRLEPLRPARHTPCRLPFAVWLALARATPVHADADLDALPPELGAAPPGP